MVSAATQHSGRWLWWPGNRKRKGELVLKIQQDVIQSVLCFTCYEKSQERLAEIARLLNFIKKIVKYLIEIVNCLILFNTNRSTHSSNVQWQEKLTGGKEDEQRIQKLESSPLKNSDAIKLITS